MLVCSGRHEMRNGYKGKFNQVWAMKRLTQTLIARRRVHYDDFQDPSELVHSGANSQRLFA